MRAFVCWLLLALCCWTVPAGADEAPPAHPRVIVVGGGIAGLVTAWKLEQKGYTVCVLEAGDRWGGRIGTAHYGDGLDAEFGMQEIWEKSPLVGIVQSLGLKLEATDDAWSSLIIDDKLYPFVQDTREAYLRKLFTPAERKPYDAALKEMEADYKEATTQGLTPKMLKLQNETYDDWLLAHHFPHKVDMALRLTIEVELASTARDFSALSAMLEYRTFLFGGEKNFHVEGGNDQIIGHLVDALHGQKLLGARVTHVVRHQQNGHLVCEVRYMQNAEEHTLQSDAVVVAVPWVMLHLIQFEPGLTPAQLQAMAGLSRGQYEVIHMITDRGVEKLWKATGGNPFPILSNGPLGVIYGPHETESKGPNFIFGLLIYGPEAQAYHMTSEDRKRAQVFKLLDHYWPGFSKYVRRSFFYSYHPCAVTYWGPGRSPLDAGSESIRTPNEGLFLCGDWTESSHSEGAVVSALKTVDKVARVLGSP